jgi:hypothetical protein
LSCSLELRDWRGTSFSGDLYAREGEEADRAGVLDSQLSGHDGRVARKLHVSISIPLKNPTFAEIADFRGIRTACPTPKSSIAGILDDYF